jgi:phosphoenolpyruvate carboxylase
MKAVLTVTGHPTLLANNPNLKRLLEMREPYIEPLNILQVGRSRSGGGRGREGERTCVCVFLRGRKGRV